MRHHAVLAVGWVLALFIGAAAAQGQQASPHVRVLTGPNGERITMTFLEPRARNELLIKFEGIEGEWNNKVLRHKRIVFERDHENFELWTARGAPNYVSIVNRASVYDVFPMGAGRPLRVVHDSDASQRAGAEQSSGRAAARR